MSATVSQAPPALYLYDVEAALPTASSPPAAPAAAPAAAPPPAVVVEIEVEPDAGAGAGTGAAGAARETPLNGTTGYASVVVVGFVGMVCAVFILSDLMNRHRLNLVATVFFLLSVSYLVPMWKWHWASLDDQQGAATVTVVAASGQPNVLTREAREALLTYFTFAHPTTAVVRADDAEGKAGQSQPMQDRQQEQQGKGLPLDADILDSSNGSRRWRWDRSTGSGQETRRASGTSSDGGGRQDDRTDTDLTPASTPIASPGPVIPVPSGQQQHPHDGDSDGDAGGGGASGAGAGAGATAVVAHTGREALEDEEEGGSEDRRVTGCERHQLRRSGSAPFDGRDPLVVPITTSNAADADSTATTGTSSDNVEETTPTSTAKTATSPVAGDLTQTSSDAGAWSTDSACIVCFGDYEDGDRLCQLPCRHVYHAECINEWLDRAKRPSCPLCKTDLVPATSSSTRIGGAARASGGGGVRAGGGDSAADGGGSGGGGSFAGSDEQEVELTGDNAV